MYCQDKILMAKQLDILLKIAICSLIIQFSLVRLSVSQNGHPEVEVATALEDVPASVLDTSDAVILLKSSIFGVSRIGSAKLSVKRVATVLNREGVSIGSDYIGYDDLQKLKSVRGRILDGSGELVRNLTSDDMVDVSATDGQSLYDGNRARLVHIDHNVFPYTIELEWIIEFNGLVAWPSWYPHSQDFYVKRSRYEIAVPEDLAFKVRFSGLNDDRITSSKGRHIYHVWERTNLVPPELESAGPSAGQQMPSLLPAPEDFEIEGIAGSFRTWKDFGDWYYRLSLGRARLSDDERWHVLGLVDGLTDRDATRTLYQYMQDRTRYVSIQLGIGGWQPIEASKVSRNGYGDCKALTNYMLALLDTAKITAHPALIRSGNDGLEVEEDFACNQFNHVLLYVPLDSGDVWLECTSQSLPFGELSAATEDRLALVVREGRSILIRTPGSVAAENATRSRTEVILENDGVAHASTSLVFSGNIQDGLRDVLTYQSDKERVDFLRDLLGLPTFEMESADFSGVIPRRLQMDLAIKVRIPRYGSDTGSRMFVKPSIMDRSVVIPKEMTHRTQPVIYDYAFSSEDSTSISLPSDYRIESIPSDVIINESFGSFESTFSQESPSSVLYFRRLSLTEKKIAPDNYDKLREFLLAVRKSGRSQIVLVKKESSGSG